MRKTNDYKKAFTALFTGIIILFSLAASAASQTRSKNASKKPAVPVILIHGIGGSDLRQRPTKGLFTDGGFPNDVLKLFPGDPQKLQFTEDGKPREDTMSKNVIAVKFYDVPGRNITDLSKYLQKNDYELDGNLFEFFYDFRYSVMDTAKELSDFIKEKKEQAGVKQVDIVGHSMGGMIAKAYLADEENAENVRNLIFVGTPHLGAPKALKALRYGDNLEVAIFDDCKLKRVAHNMPSMFNLLPGKKYFEASGEGYFYDDDDLDEDGVRGLLDFEKTVFNLKNGKETRCRMKEKIDAAPFDKLSSELIEEHTIEFHEKLDDWTKPENVKVYNLVGYGIKTIKTLRESGGKLTAEYTTEGDGTVPMWSAESVASDHIYYLNLAKLNTEHSEMIGDKDVIKQILELLKKGDGVYAAGMSAARPTKIQFMVKRGTIKIRQ